MRGCPITPCNFERIAAARTGGLWFCAGSCLCKYCEDGSLAQTSVMPAEASDKGPTVLCEDQSGRVWIGTREAGLFCYDGTDFTAVPVWPQTILSLKEDRELRPYL